MRLREYLKRDDQLLAYRLQTEAARDRMTKNAKDRDRALATKNEVPLPEPDTEMEGDTAMTDVNGEKVQEVTGSRTIVVHVGSQNLRIGLASDALPKTVPMVLARRASQSEAEENGGEPRPKRQKLDDNQQPLEPERMFGPEVSAISCTSLHYQSAESCRISLLPYTERCVQS